MIWGESREWGFFFVNVGKKGSGVTWQEGGCECEEGCSSAQEELGSLLARVGEAGAGKQEGEPCERGSISNGEDGYM